MAAAAAAAAAAVGCMWAGRGWAAGGAKTAAAAA